MAVKFRNCNGLEDFIAISDFLITLYAAHQRDDNWFQPIWEYAYTHPWFDENSISNIGIWEDNERIVAVAQYQMRLGEAFFQLHPDYTDLKPEMMEYAEKNLTGQTEDGKRHLKVYVKESDTASKLLVKSGGYERKPKSDWSMMQFKIPIPFPPIHLPEGYQLKSIADDNDLVKIDRVLWRGFDHPGEPPEESIEDRKKMQSGPNFRKDLAIVVETPDSSFGSFAGLWFDPVNKFGYVEPVATDPDYRRLGLGKAAVLEGIRRCADLGATVAYVGVDTPFYRSIGFQNFVKYSCWIKWV